MVRAPCCDHKLGLKKGAWTPEEDEKLVSFIKRNNGNHGSWRTLPKLAGLQRCGKSCRLRWTNYLRPDIKRGGFTADEERSIIQLHALLGNRWSSIASQLPGRTDNEIKNHWNTHLRKRLSRMGVDPATHRPYVNPYYSSNWCRIKPPYNKWCSNVGQDWKLLQMDHCPQSSTIRDHMAQWEAMRKEVEARLAKGNKLDPWAAVDSSDPSSLHAQLDRANNLSINHDIHSSASSSTTTSCPGRLSDHLRARKLLNYLYGPNYTLKDCTICPSPPDALKCNLQQSTFKFDHEYNACSDDYKTNTDLLESVSASTSCGLMSSANNSGPDLLSQMSHNLQLEQAAIPAQRFLMTPAATTNYNQRACNSSSPIKDRNPTHVAYTSIDQGRTTSASSGATSNLESKVNIDSPDLPTQVIAGSNYVVSAALISSCNFMIAQSSAPMVNHQITPNPEDVSPTVDQFPEQAADFECAVTPSVQSPPFSVLNVKTERSDQIMCPKMLVSSSSGSEMTPSCHREMILEYDLPKLSCPFHCVNATSAPQSSYEIYGGYQKSKHDDYTVSLILANDDHSEGDAEVFSTTKYPLLSQDEDVTRELHWESMVSLLGADTSCIRSDAHCP